MAMRSIFEGMRGIAGISYAETENSAWMASIDDKPLRTSKGGGMIPSFFFFDKVLIIDCVTEPLCAIVDLPGSDASTGDA
jgi:hypothetical protein